MQKSAYLITAIGTPLNPQEQLHHEGLECHLADQWAAGIDGILVAGSMGMMQMLRGETYRSLIECSSQLFQGKGEILVGVGDAGWARTRDRIELACRYAIDGVVVLAPYFFRVSQSQLVDYFTTLADFSPVPLYLYDLPAVTGVTIELDTYRAIAAHANIRGAKVSGRMAFARDLLEIVDDDFRVIVSEPDKLVPLLQGGVQNHLDGMFAIAPQWTKALADAAAAEQWGTAELFQKRLNDLRDVILGTSSVFGAFTAMMNARNIPGNFHTAPFPALTDKEREALIATPIMSELIASAVTID